MHSRDKAARIIQNSWRRFTDKRLFAFYRDLLAFHDQGDPVQILHAINPAEAELLDSSIGACIRFRLGGSKFPPTIYYKIYLKAPVCDINSFAPRDYTKGYGSRTEPTQSDPFSFHTMPSSTIYPVQGHTTQRSSKTKALSSETASIRSVATISSHIGDEQLHGLNPREMQGWYKRNDDKDNPWRKLSDNGYSQLFKRADPSITQSWSLSATGSSVYYGTTRRIPKLMSKAEKAKMRKEKKLRWMLRAAHLDGDLDDMMATVPGLVQTRKDKKTENSTNAEGQDIESVVKWSEMLDFDDYLLEWSQIGTTKATDSRLKQQNEIARLKRDFLTEIDQPDFDMESLDGDGDGNPFPLPDTQHQSRSSGSVFYTEPG
ncbi:putative IQ motif, EF-hand binding site [Blattamonas nauphoetae]|uniref:IQ motif, EF-hand binding site n=1 Tax=Blattamonas nauphoetae TaxID=2049346 RepID=A0ABQ9Y4J3_9EUKA|nr:putative IQ motif, EF-hand binding site [Blattamonas nauphoetae]